MSWQVIEDFSHLLWSVSFWTVQTSDTHWPWCAFLHIFTPCDLLPSLVFPERASIPSPKPNWGPTINKPRSPWTDYRTALIQLSKDVAKEIVRSVEAEIVSVYAQSAVSVERLCLAMYCFCFALDYLLNVISQFRQRIVQVYNSGPVLVVSFFLSFWRVGLPLPNVAVVVCVCVVDVIIDESLCDHELDFVGKSKWMLHLISNISRARQEMGHYRLAFGGV